MLAVFFCILFSNMAIAGILWEKELVLDANTNSAPLASCLNKDASGVIVTTIECPKGSFPVKGENILWEIGADGNTTRITPKNIDGSKVWTNARPVRDDCAIASDSNGNLLAIGISSKQKDEKGQKVAVISRYDETGKIMSPRNSIESHSIKKMLSLRDNTFALVGDQNNDGLCLQIDNQGKKLKEEQFDAGRNEKFTGVDLIKSDNPRLVIVGLSVKHSNELNAGFSGDNFVLLYDPNLKIVHEDYFSGWKSILALSLVALYPKVCYLDNGNIVALYNKENSDPDDTKTKLWARCYTQELKLLWEKEVFAAEKLPNKSPFYFYLIPYGSKGFVSVIIKPTESLEFYFFNGFGNKIGYYEYRGLVVTSGFNLIQINDKTIAVFEEFSGQGHIKEIAIKAKIIALD